MSQQRLPDGFTVKDLPAGVRWWIRDERVFVIARPHLLAGQTVPGWKVTLINVHGAVTLHISADELDELAAWHCRAIADLLLPEGVGA